jgi:hypothetical protein
MQPYWPEGVHTRGVYFFVVTLGVSVLKITHVKAAQLGFSNSRAPRLVTICSELGGKNEFMTLTVCVPNNGSDGDVHEAAIAKAKDFARHFAELPLALFPTGVLGARRG